ncbi:hypothetical protein [Actinobacillus vicugnae]|uniref:hypothetical protein n=1 Tax=Actinobacillus vicugnae TaxID=2573093 RepID=UPI001240738E|nr:hypothetical protein [Actinobacillus vicugnae]
MADITLSHITPKHFFETVKLLKMTEHRIYLTVDSIEVRFRYDRNEPPAATDKRFQQLEHFMLFLQELVNSDVPVDLDEFIRTYRRTAGGHFYKR